MLEELGFDLGKLGGKGLDFEIVKNGEGLSYGEI